MIKGVNETKKVKTDQGTFVMKKLSSLENDEAMEVAVIPETGVLNRIKYGIEVRLRSIIAVPEEFGVMPPIDPNDLNGAYHKRKLWLGERLTPHTATILTNEAVTLIQFGVVALSDDDKKKSESSSLNPTNGKTDQENIKSSTIQESDQSSPDLTLPKNSTSGTLKL